MSRQATPAPRGIKFPISTSLDENAILGLFTWDTNAPEQHYSEIDYEFGTWKGSFTDNAQYVIQPWDTPGIPWCAWIDLTGSW